MVEIEDFSSGLAEVEAMEPMMQIPSELPTLPLRDIVIYPFMIVPLFVSRDKSIKAVEDALRENRMIVLVSQKDLNKEDPAQEDLYEVGTVAIIMRMLKLPDERIKVRFFVPERSLAAYRVGRTVSFGCDGCAKGLTARIAYISPRPEFTPPVIYSREARDRLVYLVEARPSIRLNPGQPVDVEPLW